MSTVPPEDIPPPQAEEIEAMFGCIRDLVQFYHEDRLADYNWDLLPADQQQIIARKRNDLFRALQRTMHFYDAAYVDVQHAIMVQLSPYIRYIDSLVTVTPGGVDAAMRELRSAYDAALDHGGILRLVLDRHPLVAMAAQHVRTEQARENTRLVRAPLAWFETLLRNADAAHGHMQRFFDGCLQRLSGRDDPEQQAIRGFLEDFQMDLEGFLAGIIHMGTVMAQHLQKENCAVCMLTTPYKIERGQREYFTKGIATLMETGMFAKDEYRDYFPDAGVRHDIAHIPNLISVVDLDRFMEALSIFLKKMAEKAEGKRSQRKSMHGFGRERRSKEGQARVLFDIPDDPLFRQFSIRIDETGGGLTLDIGSLKAHRALQHAEHLALQSETIDTVVSYDRIINEEGTLQVEDPDDPAPRTATHPYASAMLNKNLKPGERMGLVAAAILHVSQDVTFPYPTETFSYHERGMLRLNPENAKHFPAIVRAMKKIMSR